MCLLHNFYTCILTCIKIINTSFDHERYTSWAFRNITYIRNMRKIPKTLAKSRLSELHTFTCFRSYKMCHVTRFFYISFTEMPHQNYEWRGQSLTVDPLHGDKNLQVHVIRQFNAQKAYYINCHRHLHLWAAIKHPLTLIQVFLYQVF